VHQAGTKTGIERTGSGTVSWRKSKNLNFGRNPYFTMLRIRTIIN